MGKHKSTQSTHQLCENKRKSLIIKYADVRCAMHEHICGVELTSRFQVTERQEVGGFSHNFCAT